MANGKGFDALIINELREECEGLFSSGVARERLSDFTHVRRGRPVRPWNRPSP